MSLSQLAEHLGIFPYYWDINGVQHFTDREVQKELLSTLGYPADTDEAAAEQLRRVTEEEQKRVCPPALVVRPDHAPVVRVVLHEAAPEILSYRLRFENGAVLECSQLSRFTGRDGKINLELPHILSSGYHTLEIPSLEGTSADATHTCLLIVAPLRCYIPADESTGEPKKCWGVTAQAYSLALGTPHGVGHFGTIDELCALVGESGGDAVGLNPLHALSAPGEHEYSPYSPTSRLAINPINLDLKGACQFLGVDEKLVLHQAGSKQAGKQEQAELLDYTAISAAVWSACRKLFDQFAKADSPRRADFQKFCDGCSTNLNLYATYCALHEHARDAKPDTWGWHQWPEKYRHPTSPAVAQFQQEHAPAIEYNLFLQWLCTEQLLGIRKRNAERGLGIGLYLDVALGTRSGGADSWIFQDLFAQNASMGAPPDDLAPQGQDWGLPPLLPRQLIAAGFTPFIEAVQTAMRFAGAVRLDHVMSLFRLFWVTKSPNGAGKGAYVRYPLAELQAIVTLESQRNRCMVIGEDLGTVPDEVRDAMIQSTVFSYKVFIFMKDASNHFHAAGKYPPHALVTASTHDLPTIRGFFTDWDLTVRAELKLHAPEVLDKLRESRLRDKLEILALLHREGYCKDISDQQISEPESLQEKHTAALALAVTALLAKTPSELMVVQLEDVIGERDQVNLPGTTTEHPNWRRTFPFTVSELREHPGWKQTLAEVRQGRRQ